MHKEKETRPAILRPRYWVPGAIAALLLAYALAGFLFIPWLARRELPRLVEEELHHRATVGRVEFNPFTLSLHASDFSLQDMDGRPVFGFGEATLGLAWSSLIRRAWVLSEVTLSSPAVRVAISKAGRLNLADLVPADSGPASGTPRVVLRRVTIANGLIEFEDRREGYRDRVEHVSLALSSLSTLDSDTGPYTLVGQTPGGAKLAWKGELSLTPLVATGALQVRDAPLAELNPYLDNYMQAKVVAGRADLDLPYRFELARGQPQFAVTGAKLGVRAFGLEANGPGAPYLKVGQFALEGVSYDFQTRRAAARVLKVSSVQAGSPRQRRPAADIGEIAVSNVGFDAGADSLDVDAIRIANVEIDAALEAGKLSLADLVPVRAGDKEAKQEDAKRFAARLKSLEISGGKVAYADRDSGLAVSLDGVRGKATQISSDASKPLAFDLSANVHSGGRVAVHGVALPSARQLEAKLQASGVALAPLQPILTRYTSARLASGEAALDGTLKAGGKSAKLSYAGSASVTNIAIQDRAGATMIAWKSLSTDTLRASLAPNRADVDELRWSAPSGRLAIATDGTTNVSRAMARNDAPAAQKTAVATSAAENAFPIRIRRVRVDQGRLDFSDDSVSPGFRAQVVELAGTANGVSNDRSTRGNFSFEGRVGEYGYARVFGALNPFALRERSSFRVEFRDLDVASVTPYSMRFAGYRIASGRLSLDLNYRVDAGILQGDNKIALDDFALGERVESPTARRLPLDLAVALLKGPDGKINLEVPIKGSLDDPQFSYGAIIWDAIGKAIGNIIAAPFRALAHLFGAGGEDVGSIAFDPGSARLLPPELQKLAHVAEGLAKRPEVKLVIPARYDAEADARALKRAALAREVGKRAGFEIPDTETPGPLSIDDRPTRTVLRALFAERLSQAELDKLKSQAEAKQRESGVSGARKLSLLDKVKNFAAGEPQVADPRDFYSTLLRRLRDAEPLPANALVDLAQKRAAAIAAALAAARVDPARIGVATAAPSSNGDATQVLLQLGLAAR